MLSKEEIEFNLKVTSNVMLNFEDELCDKMQERIKEIKEYINQLETDKQKLIEKLKERRKQNNNRYGQAIDNDDFEEMYEYSGQVHEDDYILKILKGEKDVK